MFAKDIINRVLVRCLPVAVVILMLSLSACGSGIEGTYSGSGTMAGGFAEVSLQVTFDSDTVIIKNRTSAMGQTAAQTETEHEYEVDGNKLKIKNLQGVTEIWTLEKDGSITVPMPGIGKLTLTRGNDVSADVASVKPSGIKDSHTTDSGFSFSKMIAKITAPNVEGTYIYTVPKGSGRLKGLLELNLDSGKATLIIKLGAEQTEEETGTYLVEGKKVKITDRNGETDIFILGDDGALMPPPGFTAGPKFIRKS